MRLLRYEGMVKVASAEGLLGNYAVGTEGKGKIEIRGDDIVLQTLKGSAEARCKLDSVTKFSWLLKPANYDWTAWFPVQLNGSPIVMTIDGANGSGTLSVDLSSDMKTMAITGSVVVKNALAKMMVSKANVTGTANQTSSEVIPDPNPNPNPNPNPGGDIPPISSRTYRTGDPAKDAGDEIVEIQHGMQIRYIANDWNNKTRGVGKPFYFMSGVVQSAGAFSIVWNPDGSATVTGKDFTSARSGLRYAFLGWTFRTDSNPLVTKYTATIPKSEATGALRGYWATAVASTPPSGKFEVSFDHAESRSNWKGCCLLDTSMGLFWSVYNNDSRKNSELWLKGVKIYSGGQETIGQGLEHNGKVYFPAECGRGLVYDGTVRETVSLRHSSLAILYNGVPCFVSSEDSGEFVINAETGAKVKQLAVGAKTGIPMSGCDVSGAVLIALADHGGSESIVTTSDIVIPLAGATAVVNWKGRILAAGNGIIYDVDVAKKTTNRFYDTGSQRVNHMWYDGPNDVLWVSTAKNDKLLFIDSSGTVNKVSEYSDMAGSGYFDSRVTTGWYYRAQNAQAQFYKVQKK